MQGGLYNTLLRALAAPGPRRRVRRVAHSDAGAERRLSAGARRRSPNSAPAKRAVLMVEEGSPNTSSRRSMPNCATPTSRPRCYGKGPLPQGRRIHLRSAAAKGSPLFREATTSDGIDADTTGGKGARTDRHKATAAAAVGPLPPRPPAFLHRLSGAACVLRAQTGAARARSDAHLRRYRLSCVRDFRAVLDGQFVLGYGARSRERMTADIGADMRGTEFALHQFERGEDRPLRTAGAEGRRPAAAADRARRRPWPCA